MYSNTTEKAYHMTIHVQWARVCQCKQEALGWLLSCLKDYGGRTAMAKKREMSSLNNKVELLA